MGLPLKRGFVCCSTEAKKASISAQRIIFDMSLLLPSIFHIIFPSLDGRG
jgi:hypothetical protein